MAAFSDHGLSHVADCYGRAVRALPEDSGSGPSTHMAAHDLLSFSRGLDALFWPLWTPGTSAQTYIHTGKTLIHIKIAKSNQRFLTNRHTRYTSHREQTIRIYSLHCSR